MAKTHWPTEKRRVLIVMGSKNDWPTMKHAADILVQLGEKPLVRITSAHRTPKRMAAYAAEAEANGVLVIIAGAGKAAHLAGGMASYQYVLPVFGVPVESSDLKGMDSLLSTAQMPRGVPVGALAIGDHGAFNAGLLAAMTLGLVDPALRERIRAFRQQQTDEIKHEPDDLESSLSTFYPMKSPNDM